MVSGRTKIAVEIKSFLNTSVITDFHAANGQFLNYRLALQMSESDRMLYLAVPIDTFESFFQEKFTQEAVKLYQVKLIIYDPVGIGSRRMEKLEQYRLFVRELLNNHAKLEENNP